MIPRARRAAPTARPPAVLEDPRWAAVRARDARADGTFYYAVRTTGVYCRPSCGSRTPRPDNVALYTTREDAERDGYRACKRCTPAGPSAAERQAAVVAELCRWIEATLPERSPTLAELAERAGLSPHHLQRVFTAVVGVSPKAYAAACRARLVREALARTPSVTEAIHEAGYGSSARFYEASTARLGMTPSAYRAGGEHHAVRFAVGQSSLGAVLVAATARGVVAISLGDEPEALVHELERRFPQATLVGDDPEFARWVSEVVGLVESPARGVELPLDIRGTAFQQRVWAALTRIPSGQTTTYAALAESLGAPRAVRAVAQACARNTLAVAIPCHRVVRTDGALAGYRWGIARKHALLEREK